MDNRQEIKKLLPYGAMKDIAKRANIHPSLVSHYFAGLNNSTIVENEALKFLEDIAENRRELLKKALS